jgi:hypothetical protein
MGTATIPGYQCSCDICGATFPAALDAATAAANAAAAGFKTYTIPTGAPRAGAGILVCPSCKAGVAGL